MGSLFGRGDFSCPSIRNEAICMSLDFYFFFSESELALLQVG